MTELSPESMQKLKKLAEEYSDVIKDVDSLPEPGKTLARVLKALLA